MFLLKLAEALRTNNVPYAVVGGLAVALHGVTRSTLDIDFVIQISKTNFESVEKALKELGLASRIPVTAKEMAQFRLEYIEKKNLLAWSFSNPKNPIETVDIIIILDRKDIQVEIISIYGIKIPLISKKDLIEMKTKSGRPQDLEDVKALKSLIS